LLSGKGPLSGAKVVNLSPAVAEEIGLEGPSAGVLVLDIARGSIAARVGLEKGDRVLMLNDRKIESVKSLAAINAEDENLWKVTIQRGAQVITRMFRF
jgi:S1-C subfamily serine protease